jgi:chromosomal replication initiation ATPase DnaA
MIHEKLPTVDQIVLQSCVEHGVTLSDLLGPSRDPALVAARWTACRRLRVDRRMSGPEIARAVGYRSHTSVLKAIKGEQAEAGR